MERYRQQIFIAFGYFCFFAALIFFCFGAGIMALLVYSLFDNAGDGASAGLMIPFGLILMFMGAAIFKLGQNIVKSPNGEETEDE